MTPTPEQAQAAMAAGYPAKCTTCGKTNADPRPWNPSEAQCPDCQDLAATPDALDREAVARLIDPLAWAWADDLRDDPPESADDERLFDPRAARNTHDSLAKADAILALLAPARTLKPSEGDLERAAMVMAYGTADDTMGDAMGVWWSTVSKERKAGMVAALRAALDALRGGNGSGS